MVLLFACIDFEMTSLVLPGRVYLLILLFLLHYYRVLWDEKACLVYLAHQVTAYKETRWFRSMWYLSSFFSKLSLRRFIVCFSLCHRVSELLQILTVHLGFLFMVCNTCFDCWVQHGITSYKLYQKSTIPSEFLLFSTCSDSSFNVFYFYIHVQSFPRFLLQRALPCFTVFYSIKP